MKTARSIMLAIAATLGASGCRAWSPGTLTPTPRPLAERTLDVDEFVAEHNRNADRIQTLEARPTIGVSGRMKTQADGRLAMERPRNFKLELLAPPMRTVKADIGSNDDEFWYWVDNDENRIYWCNYDELDSTALGAPYQPDWIIAALGLKPITPDEAAGIKVNVGDEPGTTALVFPPTKNGGQTYTRMMIVSNHNRRIKQHRLYQGTVNSKNLLAQAKVSRFTEFDAGKDEGDAQTCYLPESVTLEWLQDHLLLNVTLRDVKLNQQFDTSRRAALFVEPVVTGHQRVNLADLGRAQRKDSRTTVRDTLPPPPTRNGSKLGRPRSVPDDTSMAPRRKTAVPARTHDSTTSPLEDVVTAPQPVAPETAAMQAANAVSTRNDLYQIER